MTCLTSYLTLFKTKLDVTCEERGDVHCLSVKETDEHVVRFTLQSFQEGINYTVCVLAQGKCSPFKACSNGFLIDLHPPIAGHVELGEI